MTIVRWNPIREMASMQNAIDRIFDETWRSVRPSFTGDALALDVHENENHYTVITALPGLKPEQISVSLHDGVLTISGEMEQTRTEENVRVLLQERAYGKFSRSVRLPQAIDGENVQASYDNGVLTLTLPKTPEAKPRQIPVRTTVNQN
jgi:HSP20 family protein